MHLERVPNAFMEPGDDDELRPGDDTQERRGELLVEVENGRGRAVGW
jgi:hypothetical protein